jgi:hypothetical protein
MSSEITLFEISHNTLNYPWGFLVNYSQGFDQAARNYGESEKK